MGQCTVVVHVTFDLYRRYRACTYLCFSLASESILGTLGLLYSTAGDFATSFSLLFALLMVRITLFCAHNQTVFVIPERTVTAGKCCTYYLQI